ncbi:hypothetical protein CU097_009772 [Rhizopus azygosporus]|uniref:Uncharacterized protein n=1 Tax=Rhizopus azygosporus TaxID=86630 RepID=A0A367JBQ9_RHIAZ|nr:hypothetical protein CU097_009772 [Rhizopus azygosporus]
MRLIINNGVVINPPVLHVDAKGNLKVSCSVAEDGKCCSLITQHTGLMMLMLKYCKKDTIVDCSHFVGDDCKDVDGYVHLSLKLTLERISAIGMDGQRKDDNSTSKELPAIKYQLLKWAIINWDEPSVRSIIEKEKVVQLFKMLHEQLVPDVAFDKVDLRAKRNSNDEFEERNKKLLKAALASKDLVDDICNTRAEATHGIRMLFVSNPPGFK